jgi:hypothetical protein
MRTVMCLSSGSRPQAQNLLKSRHISYSTESLRDSLDTGDYRLYHRWCHHDWCVGKRNTRIEDDGRRWAVADELRAEVANSTDRSHGLARDRTIVNAVYASQKCGDGRAHVCGRHRKKKSVTMRCFRECSRMDAGRSAGRDYHT